MFLLFAEGHAVGALILSGVCLVGTNQNTIQRAVVLAVAVVAAAVYAAADGVVSEVTMSKKGLGNVVAIDHGNGYKTRYAHLADVVVRKGRKVKKGTKIGSVGVSGNSFAPHLHYEVLRDTLVLDPVNYLFASVTPEEYLNMVIMSVSTGQSMD